MSYYFPTPKTVEDIERQKKANIEPNTWSPVDLWTGFKEENLPVMAFEAMMDDSDFPPEEGYNSLEDPQLENYKDYADLFYFSQSSLESTAILNKLMERAETNYSSPWYHLGRVTGAFTDPSTALLFTKFGTSAKLFGSALLAEEFAKQNIDPVRSDTYVPWVAAAGFGIPLVLGSFKSPINVKTQQNVSKLDKEWNTGVTKTREVWEDGRLIDGNEIRKPSDVGAAATEGVSKKTLAQIETEALQGEEFIKTYLSVFGESGPWTPVFRVIKSSSLRARNMITELLDTPLLKLKNTKEWGFQSSGKSLETDLRMLQVGEIESLKEIKELYLKYVGRMKQSVPKGELMIMLKNTFNKEFMSIRQFAHEVTRARIMGNHKIPEVAQASRVTQDKVYKPIFKESEALKIREKPVLEALKFWETTLARIKAKKEGVAKFWSRFDQTELKYSKTEIENTIQKLTERLAIVRKGGVNPDNYINLVYIKDRIDKNQIGFRKIIEDDFASKGITINKSRLDQLVEDLSNHFPFLRYEKTSWKTITKLEDEVLARIITSKLIKQSPTSKAYKDTLSKINKQIEDFKLKGKSQDSIMKLILGEKEGAKSLEEALKEIEYEILKHRFVFNSKKYARSHRARELNLSPASQEKLLDQGFILGDIFALQKVYYRSMTPDILLTKKYGDTGGLGTFYKSEAESAFFPGLLQVAQEYNAKISKITNRAEALKLTKEKHQVLGDLEASIELLRGTYGLPANPHAWYSKGMRMMKHYNALTMLTGFLAALPDVARTVMTSGIKRGFATQFEMFANGFAKDSIYAMGKKEAQSFAEAVDMITGQRAMLFSDIGDMFGMSSTFEGMLGKASHINFMYINLMSRWTEFAKAAASVTIGSRILEDSIKWSKEGINLLKVQYVKIPEGKAMASFNRSTNQVIMDLERIKKSFNNKSWTKPKIEGVNPLPLNQFKTFDEWKNFIYYHELSHWKNTRLAKETLAQYENRINQLALNKTNIKNLNKLIQLETVSKSGLADKWKTALASSGIDADMARRIAVQFEQHGEKLKYNYMANTALWTDDAAVKAFGGALNKDINITIVTPGKGDTPLWMSTEVGSTWAQFKKFAMAAQHRMLMRGMQEKDMDFLFGAFLLLGSGMMIDAIYHKYRFNRSYAKLPLTTKLLNAFDRSGLAAIYTDINKAIETLTDNRIGIAPALGAAKPYSPSGRWRAGTFGGPTAGQIYNIFDILYDVTGSKYNHHTAKNVRRLIPWQNVWYLDWLFDDIEKGLRFK
tara:strand:- start:1494 stop:5294 length:3801 start_codon:yes stop_codon:yes gene_type:complete